MCRPGKGLAPLAPLGAAGDQPSSHHGRLYALIHLVIITCEAVPHTFSGASSGVPDPYMSSSVCCICTLGRPLKSSGAGDIKDELRRAGLLTLPPGDSYSAHSSLDTGRLQQQQQQQLQEGAATAGSAGRLPPGRHVFDAELSVSNSLILEDGLGAPAETVGCVKE
jgi:hypothetical protein